MELITRFELAAKSENELHGMLRKAFNELANSNLESHKRRNALASISKTFKMNSVQGLSALDT